MDELGGMSATQWVPCITVARLLKVSKARVYALVKERKVTSQKVDGVVLIALRSVQAYDLLRSRSKGRSHASR